MSNVVPREDDYGFALIVDLEADVSAATTMSIIIRKPDRTISTKAASFTTDGTDGLIQWTVTDGFLDQEGIYHVEGEVSDGATFQWRSILTTFEVGGKIE